MPNLMCLLLTTIILTMLSVLTATFPSSADWPPLPSAHKCVFESKTTYGVERAASCEFGRHSCADWEDIPFIKDTDYGPSDAYTFTLSLKRDKFTVIWASGDVEELTDVFIGFDMAGASKVVGTSTEPAYRSMVLHQTGEMFSTFSNNYQTSIFYGRCSPK